MCRKNSKKSTHKIECRFFAAIYQNFRKFARPRPGYIRLSESIANLRKLQKVLDKFGRVLYNRRRQQD